MEHDARRREVDAPAVIESVDVVQDAFAAWWAGLGIDAVATRFALETAVVEIAANIVEHTRRADGAEGRRLRLELIATDDDLRAVFTDNGQPAEIDLSAVSMADEEDESGRGLALALAALDHLDYRHEGGRNVWTLVCRR